MFIVTRRMAKSSLIPRFEAQLALGNVPAARYS
jgi:hypothetical protein